MTGLGIHDRDGAELETGILENATAHRHIRLALGKTSRLQFRQWVEAQRRGRRRIGPGRTSIRDAACFDRNFRDFLGLS